jgi:hyperosmotically inducible protein
MTSTRLMTLFILLSLPSMLGACVPVLLGGAAAGGYYVGQDERPLDVISRDAGITASVKTRLFKEKDLSAFDIDVDTYEGVVTLYGNVPDLDHANRAAKIARETQGVKRVESKLTVVREFKGKKYYEDEDKDTHPDVDMPEDLPEKKQSSYPID